MAVAGLGENNSFTTMADDRVEQINHEDEGKSRFAVKGPVIIEECAEVDEQETTVATRYNIFDGIVDVIIAILPIYFIVFAIMGYVRNGTSANSLIDLILGDNHLWHISFRPSLCG